MSITDERVRFYLRNRERIEEWASLRKEAAAALDGWLEGLRPGVTDLAKSLGATLNPRIEADSEWPTYQLVRSSWPIHQSGEPLVSVALQWRRGYVTLGPGEPPCVGVICHNTHALGAALRASGTLKSARQNLGHKTSSWYVAYGYVLPGAEVPETFERYGEALIAELARVWDIYVPIIDATIASPPA